MDGLMMDYQLTLPTILRRAESYFGGKRIVTRLPGKSFHSYTYADMTRRAKQLAVTQAFLPHLRRARGRIVNVGSIAGRSSLPFLGAYAASKHALEAVTVALRVELRPFGIEVAIVEPATIATPIWTKGGENVQRLLAGLPADVLTLYGERMAAFRNAAAAAARGAEPAEEVAKVVEHALTAERPKTRYRVGRDARRRSRVERLPDRLRDRVYERLLLRV